MVGTGEASRNTHSWQGVVVPPLQRSDKARKDGKGWRTLLVRLLQRNPLLKLTKPIQHDVDLWRCLLLGLHSRRVLHDEKLLSIGSDVVRTSIGIREIDKSR